ncbi:MAG: type III-A CRISPR-associated RAMP protein Csm3 [Clostridiales bacterium]|jgi:CRISPR-associated protein Csm3|nr:type III-A CRISPR-associated RAMP protein Csm3 [Clostridiales bacterium]
MYTKILFEGEIEVITGLHIGGGTSFSAIGAVDSPVVKDAPTGQPIIPGSSLKGKMRSLLARSESDTYKTQKHSDDPEQIRRLFGDTENFHSRLQFFDCFMVNKEALGKRQVIPTEVKFENTIDRLTSVAKPRQIERVVPGAKFSFKLTYELADDYKVDFDEDCGNVIKAFGLLEKDYLGGGGTRGNGRIKFNNMTAKCVCGEVENLDEDIQAKI